MVNADTCGVQEDETKLEIVFDRCWSLRRQSYCNDRCWGLRRQSHCNVVIHLSTDMYKQQNKQAKEYLKHMNK